MCKRNTDLSVPLRCSRVMVKIACDREDAAFIAVEPTVRAEFPSSRQPTISLAETTCRSVNPTIWKMAQFFISVSHNQRLKCHVLVFATSRQPRTILEVVKWRNSSQLHQGFQVC